MPNHLQPHGDERHNTMNEGWKQRRLVLPGFNGENRDGWIAKVEHYFSVYNLPETEKMTTAVVGLEGRALNWWQWIKHRKTITSWAELKSLLLHYFRPHNGRSLCEQWLSVIQEGTVAEYSEKFILYAAPLTHIPEDVILSTFIKGLKPLIHVELRMWNPDTIEMAIDWVMGA